MPKSKEAGDSAAGKENDASSKFKGELLANYPDSSESEEEAPRKRGRKSAADLEKGDRPARKPKVRISQYVRAEAPPPVKFVMKLFDRSVDLAQFTLDTPLYPICRAWFRNNPHDHSRSEKLKKDEESKNFPKSQLYSSEAWHDPFIFPKGKPSEDFQLEYDTMVGLPTKEELLKSNMVEWKAVRSHAKNESNKRFAKYKNTLESLRKKGY